MDDFFVNEEGRFVYEADMDEVYRKQLVKLLSRQMDNGLFNFLLVDAVNRSAAELEELAVQARSRQFQVGNLIILRRYNHRRQKTRYVQNFSQNCLCGKSLAMLIHLVMPHDHAIVLFRVGKTELFVFCFHL